MYYTGATGDVLPPPANASSAAALQQQQQPSTRPSRATASTLANGHSSRANGGANRESELQIPLPEEQFEGASSNWEIAYVYAFVTKFTPIRNIANPASLLLDVSSLENALVESSPPPGSKLIKVAPPPRLYGYANQYGSYLARPPPKFTDYEDDQSSAFGAAEGTEGEGSVPGTPAGVPGTEETSVVGDESAPAEGEVASAAPAEEDPFLTESVPTASPLLVEIIKHFESNLYLPEFENSHGRRDWFSWLVRFVNKRLLTVNRGGFDWEYNLLKRVGVKSGSEKEQEFWLLKWQDKIHLMRQMVDYQLMHSHNIRTIIDQHYDLGKQRVSKRDPMVNPLIIDRTGELNKRVVWHLDDSPRLYASTNPTQKNGTWNTIVTTASGYSNLIESLPEPDREQWALMQEQAAAAAVPAGGKKPTGSPAPVALKGTKGRGRGKGKQVEEMNAEQLLRAKLEQDWPAVQVNEKAVDAINTKRNRALDRATNKDLRVAKQLAKHDPYGGTYNHSTSSRSTRLRTQSRQIDYVYGEGSGPGTDGSVDGETPRKRARGDTDGEGWGTEDDGASGFSTPGSVGGRGTPGGSGRRQASRLREEVATEWKGERRSSRIQLKTGNEVDEEGQWEGLSPAVADGDVKINSDALPPLPPFPTADGTIDLSIKPEDKPEENSLKVVDDDLTTAAANGHVTASGPAANADAKSLPTSVDIANAEIAESASESKPVTATNGDFSVVDTFAEGVQSELAGAVGAEMEAEKTGAEAMDVDVAGAEA